MTEPRDLFYLWHLEHVGVLTRREGGFAAPLWDAAADRPPVTVALIDTGIDTGHPNLAGALAGPQVDFGRSRSGTVFAPPGDSVDALRRALATGEGSGLREALQAALAEVRAHAAALGLDLPRLEALAANAGEGAQAAEVVDAAQAFVDALRGPDPAPQPAGEATLSEAASERLAALGLEGEAAGQVAEIGKALAAGPEVLAIADPSRFFGAHGTACAGLVGGRPATAQASAHPFYGALPYYGANPHCRILSYATPYSHEIRPVLRALVAAWLAGAEVILMPRGLPDVAARAALPASPSRLTRIDCDDATLTPDDDQASQRRLAADARLFEAVLAAVAKQSYVVLAAGNDGLADELGYPASKAAEVPEVLVVGARTRDGRVAGYSNGPDLGARLLYMVSDDAAGADADGLAIDAASAGGADFDFAAHFPPGAEGRFSPWAPLTLDVRGGYGYAASNETDAPDYHDGVERGAIYTLFGGTSAASSLAAGCIALLLQAGRLPERPPAAGEVAALLAKEGLGVPA